MNYRFGNKNNWRRWVWNRLAERIIAKDDAVILYLPGPLDLDREIAISKGFKSHNLIAVENDPNTLAAMRSRGHLVIDGELSQVLLAWPQDRPVSAVIGDFCCGLEKGLQFRLRQALLNKSPFINSVFVFNFLRGRDASSNFIREVLIKGETKHRGIIFICITMQAFIEQCRDHGWTEKEIQYFYSRWHDLANPLTHWYKSGIQRFDSVIFTNSIIDYTMLDEPVTEFMQRRKAVIEAMNTIDIGKGMIERRRIAAIIAHRTMRLN